MPAEGMVAVKRYKVLAKRWAQGWELHIRHGASRVGVTQVRTLDSAERQVRDYLESLLGIDSGNVELTIQPDLGGLEDTVSKVIAASRAAAVEQLRAAEQVRTVAAQLRQQGLSVSDTAAVMKVSRGRISQLTASKSSAKSGKSRAKSGSTRRTSSRQSTGIQS